jgi:hypothetical protein
MALALVALGTFYSLLEVTLIGVRMAQRAEYSAASIHMCAGCVSCAIWKRGSIFPCRVNLMALTC